MNNIEKLDYLRKKLEEYEKRPKGTNLVLTPEDIEALELGRKALSLETPERISSNINDDIYIVNEILENHIRYEKSLRYKLHKLVKSIV